MTAAFIGRYEIEEVCWIEPVGRVVRGRLPELNRRVLLRELCPPATLLPADGERLLRGFEAECRLLAALEDPRVPRPCDAGATGRGTRFVAYEEPEASGF